MIEFKLFLLKIRGSKTYISDRVHLDSDSQTNFLGQWVDAIT